MNSILISILSLLPLQAPAAACPPAAAIHLREAKQLILVQSPSWNTARARMSWWQRKAPSERWQPVKTEIPAVIGRAGLAWGYEYTHLPAPLRSANQPLKHEGDGRTPAGVHRLGKRFGFTAQKGDALLLTSSTACVDDPRSRHYNRIVDTATTARDWKSAEMMRAIDVYKLGFLIDYQSSSETQAGSCIFAHIWNGPEQGTAGCLGASEDRIAELQAWIKSDDKPAIAFLTEEDSRAGWAECLNLTK